MERSHVRMICNAAGGLLPSLAAELKATFSGAVVLPSYGMTEYVLLLFFHDVLNVTLHSDACQ
jgi:acyl-CoA synthetase (AMP-forming)/AMP-acid ligase II